VAGAAKPPKLTNSAVPHAKMAALALPTRLIQNFLFSSYPAKLYTLSGIPLQYFSLSGPSA
jgi:hypothetical protein